MDEILWKEHRKSVEFQREQHLIAERIPSNLLDEGAERYHLQRICDKVRDK